ncbi:isoamyl acetate-hydrolyzing esterase 1 homolog isoform X2 [Saccostrea cucullata]|uniref:isoamyl acetate-hydrolyzing esterase 1 homolog isoform X2 n=1 Tax=Saccostrea cuccullata TaxID=36930 RepID=UPI002ED41849
MSTNKSRAKSLWKKVLLVGDSLTQFGFSKDGSYASLLADYLQRKCDVINRGFSGYNSKWCKIILPDILNEFDPEDIALATIFLGANDSNLPENKRQHVPLADYKQDLKDMVDMMMKKGIPKEKIVLISPPACDEKAWKKFCLESNKDFTKCNLTAGKYADVCLDAARECGTKSVDFYGNMMKRDDWQDLLCDGLHLSAAGSLLLFKLLKPAVDQTTSELPLVFPNFNDVDIEDLHGCLKPFPE